MSEMRPIVFAITGASGAPYAVGLLRALVEAKRPVQLIVSDHGWRLLQTESDIADVGALQAATGGKAWKGLVTAFDDRGESLGVGGEAPEVDRRTRGRRPVVEDGPGAVP